jgi:hypothetical protein
MDLGSREVRTESMYLYPALILTISQPKFIF